MEDHTAPSVPSEVAVEVAEDEEVVKVVAADTVDVALAMIAIARESPTSTTHTTSGRSLHQSRNRKSVSSEKIVTSDVVWPRSNQIGTSGSELIKTTAMQRTPMLAITTHAA